MKKLLFLIICILNIFQATNAFFGEPGNLDLYKNIDSGFEQLEEKMLLFELNGGTGKKGILREINKYAVLNEKPSCLKESEEISIEKFKKIAEESDITELSKYLQTDCSKNQIIADETAKIEEEYESKIDEAREKWGNSIINDDGTKDSTYAEYTRLNREREFALEDIYTGEDGIGWENFSTKIITIYLELFRKYNNDKKLLSEVKSEKLYKLSNIGLYSDGDIENSGFDLIDDIAQIDKIIFEQDTDFEGSGNKNLSDAIDSTFQEIEEKFNKIEILDPDNTKNIYKPLINIKSDDLNNETSPIIPTSNNYVCIDSEDSSGLDNENILSLIDINSLPNNIDLNSSNNEDSIYNTGAADGNNIVENTNGAYSPVNDNSEWPCETFFCINIEMIMYRQNLFGGGGDITIEYLLNRSNKHLKKFAAAYLGSAKMTTDLWEVGLQDINLGDVFHLGFQIITKPVPILKLEKPNKEDETELAAKNMLEKYYKSFGLNYERRNDLNAVINIEQDKQNAIAALEMKTINMLDKQTEYYKIYSENKKKIKLINKSIEKKVSYGIMDTFEEQYTMVNDFSMSINNYIFNIHGVISKMIEIPTNSG